jgi:hypothetical protein
VTAEPLEAASLVDLAVRRLRAEILAGELAPGERIVEEQLTRRFGTSRARCGRRCACSASRAWSNTSPAAACASRNCRPATSTSSSPSATRWSSSPSAAPPPTPPTRRGSTRWPSPSATNLRREADQRPSAEGPLRHRRLFEAVRGGDLATILDELTHHGARTYLVPELDEAVDVSAWGSWPAYLAAVEAGAASG